MGWPQIFVLLLVGITLGMHFARHGEPMKHNYNAAIACIWLPFYCYVLYVGGFFG